jgi:hypothetical protein
MFQTISIAFKTSAIIYPPTQCHITEDLNLQQACCESLKSCKKLCSVITSVSHYVSLDRSKDELNVIVSCDCRKLWYSLVKQWLGKSQYPTFLMVKKAAQWFEQRRQTISRGGWGLSCSMPRITLGKSLIITCSVLRKWTYARGAQIWAPGHCVD